MRNLYDLPLFIHEVGRLVALVRFEHEREGFFRTQIQLVFALQEQVLVIALENNRATICKILAFSNC